MVWITAEIVGHAMAEKPNLGINVRLLEREREREDLHFAGGGTNCSSTPCEIAVTLQRDHAGNEETDTCDGNS